MGAAAKTFNENKKKASLTEITNSTDDAKLKGYISGTDPDLKKAATDRLAEIYKSRTEQIKTDPTFKDLPDSEIKKIAADPTHPLNPNSPNYIHETKTPEGQLAESERIQKEQLAKKQQQQILGFAGEYDTSAKARRDALAKSLSDKEAALKAGYESELGRYGQDLATSRQKTFEAANPKILEDLNRRGLFTSESAVNQAQAEKLKELQAADESKMGDARLGLFGDLQNFSEQGSGILNNFDTGNFEAGQELRGQGLSTLLGGSQSALDSALELRRGGLEHNYASSEAAANRAFSESLARKQRQNDLYAAGIGAVGAVGEGAANCFTGDMLIDMADGKRTRISTIVLEDRTLGGIVRSIRVATIENGDLYSYRGVTVTGCHAVKENGKWLRVKDSTLAIPIKGDPVVYTLVTSKHRIFINGIEFADEIETDDGQYTSMEDSLRSLNNKEELAYA